MALANDKQFALAAAHAVTGRTITTWYSPLPRTPRVLVPVHLEALVVRQAVGEWAKCAVELPPVAARPERPGDALNPVDPLDPLAPIDLEKFLPPPFANLPGPRPRGAYLHWALPDGLSHGTQARTENPDGTTTDELTFPAVPDRWLVLRLAPSPNVPNRRTVRGWILQAGDANPARRDLDGWIEPGVPPAGVEKPLTALGHGEPSWAGYFDNVLDRMAFYDPLTDVPAGPVAYLVCGWFSDPALDPLGDATIRSLGDFDRKLQELRWSLADKDFHRAVKKSQVYISATSNVGLKTTFTPGATLHASEAFNQQTLQVPGPGTTPSGPPYLTDGSWWPRHTLYHGSVVGIGWPSIGWPGNPQGTLSGEEGGPPAPNAVKVVVGNSLAEAMATLTGETTGSLSEARILEAFQLGLLNDLDEPDGRARVDALMHASAFGSMPGGEEPERVFELPSGKAPEPPATPVNPDPGVFKRYQRTTRKPTQFELESPNVSNRVQDRSFLGEVDTKVFQAKSLAGEVNVRHGGISEVFKLIDPVQEEPFRPGRWVEIKHALPRFFHPTDPVVLLQGLKRSFQYGEDGRFSCDGTLQCRLTGTCVHQFLRRTGDITFPPIYPTDILDRNVENGSVPPECEELLGEVALLDPGSSAPVVQSAAKGRTVSAAIVASEIKHVMVEQTAWWATRDPRVDHAPLVAQMSYAGMLPSPVAVTPPWRPWSPLHLEWCVKFIPSPDGRKDWELGEVDYNESAPKLPPANAAGGIKLEGRTALTAGANKHLADAIRLSLKHIASTGGSAELKKGVVVAYASEVSQKLLTTVANLQVSKPGTTAGVDRSQLEDIATSLESMDVLSSGFGGLHRALRGGIIADGVSTPEPSAGRPSPFLALRAGFLRVLRLRLVDCFGQFVDLAGSNATTPANPGRIIKSEPLIVTSRPELIALPPRFTSPARLWLRLLDAAGTEAEASLTTDVQPGKSPVCGYLMPNHLDSALEFFGADGANLGVVRPADEGGIVWEDAPGRPSTVGQSPERAVPNQFLAGIGKGLIEWGVADAGLAEGHDTALEGLLRVIDSTLWTVDPFGHQGDEHLALLVGHPIVVLRALLKLEVKEPVDQAAADIEQVPVRLGSLAHWQDGLLGFFVNDDYKKLFCAPAAAGLARLVGPNRGYLQQANLVQRFHDNFSADLPPGGGPGSTPVLHRYADTTGVIYVHPGQDVRLTLLVEPHTLVHATAGLLPCKEIGMKREWVKDGLAKLAPTFRFGPVLIDPKRIRMPIPHDINGTWSWDHRTDVTTWVNDPVIHATQDAILPPDPPQGSEGWLRLTPPDEGLK